MGERARRGEAAGRGVAPKFGFGARPIRLDYLVFLWAFVPWLYRRAAPFGWLRPSTWNLGSWATRGYLDRRVREFLGLRA